MNSLDNYIYYSICEKSIEFAEKSHYMTYRTYCISIRNSMKQQDLSRSEDEMIYGVSDEIRLIYGIGPLESIEYIFNYFLEEKYVDYEEPVKLIRNCFNNSFN